MAGVGFVTINNYPKLIDIWVACGAFVLGWLMVFVGPRLKIDFVQNVSEDFECNWADWIGLYVFFLLLVMLTKKGIEFLVVIPPILVYAVYQSTRLKSFFGRVSKYLLFGAALFAGACLFSTFSTLVVFSCILLAIFFKSNRKEFILLSAGFFLAKHSGGDFPIADAFHAAEHFLSTYVGIREIFSNLGCAEEVIPYILDSALRKFGLGLPMNEAIIISAFFFKALIFFVLYKRSPLLAFLSLLALPEDRVSLLFAIFISLVLVSENCKLIFKVALIALLPIWFAVLSPPYFAILCIAVSFAFTRFEFKYAFFTGVLLMGTTLATHSELFSRAVTYLDFSASSVAEHGTPMGKYYVVPNLIRLVVAGLSGFVLVKIFASENKKIRRWICYFVVLMCGYVYIGYAFNRIDPGYGRIVPVALGFFLVASLANAKITKLGTLALIFIIAMYPQFGFTSYISPKIDKEWKISEDYLLWSDENKRLANSINQSAKGNEVILYGMSPGLLPLIKNGSVPYFTTPWVTSGKKAQEKVVDYLRENPRAIIFLGHSFVIQDGVDVRARAPLVFAYINDKYRYRTDGGIIFAVPRTYCCDIGQAYDVQPINLGKTGLYYSKWSRDSHDFSTIKLSCNPQRVGIYQLSGNGGSYEAYLECGDGNKFPRALGIADGVLNCND